MHQPKRTPANPAGTEQTAATGRDRLAARSDLVVHELDGEWLVFDPVSADTHRLNETAGLIFTRADGGNGVQDIVEAVTTQYDIPEPAARKHVTECLGELISKNLLKASTPDATEHSAPDGSETSA